MIFTQGGSCEYVLYIQRGSVKLSVLSKRAEKPSGRSWGSASSSAKGCLAGQPVRMGSATAMTDSTILLVDKDEMVELLHKQHALPHPTRPATNDA